MYRSHRFAERWAALLFLLGRAPAGLADAPTTAPATTVETIVFLRHGEKAAGGMGQLSPQGLNRAIALSTLLPQKFGRPDFIFAPNPSASKMREGDGVYDYVRPLATIEPTAIALGMPVHTPFGFTQIDQLNAEITAPEYAGAVIFIAWEHAFEERAAVKLMQQFGGAASNVPHWSGGDHDSLYVLKITRTPGQPAKIDFVHDHEGLDHLSKDMPSPQIGR